MKGKELTEGNTLIAEFMGAEANKARTAVYFKLPVNKLWMTENLSYEEDWNWLMPVVEKIEKETNWTVCIVQGGCAITDYIDNTLKEFDYDTNDKGVNSKIKATWQAVVEFIKWYNTQSK